MSAESVTSNVDPKPARKYGIIIVGCVLYAMLLAVSSVGVAASRSGQASSSEVAASQARTDCRSAYNATQTEVLRARDDKKLELDVQRDEVDLRRAEGQPYTAADVELFRTTLDELNTLRIKVKNLPKLDDAVNRGWSLDGVSYPPCPS